MSAPRWLTWMPNRIIEKARECEPSKPPKSSSEGSGGTALAAAFNSALFRLFSSAAIGLCFPGAFLRPENGFRADPGKP
jgi:hypothetical protein